MKKRSVKALGVIFCIVNLSWAQVSLFDDFNGTDIDTTLWELIDNGGSYSVSGGILTLTNGAGYPQGFGIISKDSVFQPAKISFRVRTTLDTSVGRYFPQAGFSDMRFGYSNYIYWPGGNQMVWHYGIVSAWRVDSIIWRNDSIQYFVEDSLIATITGSFPGARKARFYIYCDQLGGCSLYDLWIDWVSMTGASLGIEQELPKKNKENSPFPEILYIPSFFNDAILLKFAQFTKRPLKISLYNVSGERVFLKDYPAIPYSLTIEDKKISQLPKGVYFLKISSEKTELRQFKLIKQ